MANSTSNFVDLPDSEESNTPRYVVGADRLRKREVRPSTINVSRITSRQRATERALYPEANSAQLPKTRGDCEDGIRPCPFVSCRHNLYLDVWPNNGNIRLNFPDLDPDEMPAHASCALDVADAGGITLETAGEYANITRERLRQIEAKALDNLRAEAGHLEDCVQGLGEEPEGSALAQLQAGHGGAGVSEEDAHLTPSDDPHDRARRLANRAYGRLLAEQHANASVVGDEDEETRGERAGRLGAAAKWGAWSSEDQAELETWLRTDPWASKIANALDDLAAVRADEAELIARAGALPPTEDAWSPESDSTIEPSLLDVIGPPVGETPLAVTRTDEAYAKEPSFMKSVQTLLRKHTERAVQEATGASVTVVDAEPRRIAVSDLHGQKRLIFEVLNESPSASTEEIARRTGIGIGSVYAAISKLRAWGLLPPSNRPKRTVVNYTSGFTANQERVLEAYRAFVAEHGTEPSYSQLRDRAGLPSSGTAANVVHTLRLRGLIPPETMPKIGDRFAHLEAFLKANGPSRPHEYAEATHTPIDAARKSMCRHWRAGRLYRLDGVYSIERLSKEEWSRIRAEKVANKSTDAHPKSGDRLDHIIAFIREHGPVTAADYASESQIPLGTAKDSLRNHARSGRLTNSDGVYSLVEENSQPTKCTMPPIAATRPMGEGQIMMPLTMPVDPWANVHPPEPDEPVRVAPSARAASDEPAYVVALRIERAKHEDVIADAKRKIEAIDEFIRTMTAA